MTTVKVIITTHDGEVLEEFVAAPMREKFEDGPISLSREIRDKIEMRFNCADTLDDFLGPYDNLGEPGESGFSIKLGRKD